MADIQIRFNREMLVMNSSVASALERQGVDVGRDLEFMNLIEPDTVRDILRLEMAAGAPLLVLGTRNMTPAQLARRNMEDRAFELSVASLTVAASLRPQHVLVEIAPCGLPLDSSSKTSLNEHKNQYVETARIFEKSLFDAYLLNDFDDVVSLKCALMGLRQVSDRPIFASVTVDAQGALRRGVLEEAAAVMEEYGASVVGFCTKADLDAACALTRRAAKITNLPLLVQLDVVEKNPRQGVATEENPYYCADTWWKLPRVCGQRALSFCVLWVLPRRLTRGFWRQPCSASMSSLVEGENKRWIVDPLTKRRAPFTEPCRCLSMICSLLRKRYGV